MSAWEVLLYPEAENDLADLDGSSRVLALKAIEKVSRNPLPREKGGHGDPLGNKGGRNLTGFMKIKLKGAGIRVIYRLAELNGKMAVVVVGSREDEEAYELAAKRADAFEEWLREQLGC